ncbi:MAG: hypothetical protein JWQ01_1162, partial [Massilia sp.]|nr:hypothetical protein [Massilia sp.]
MHVWPVALPTIFQLHFPIED